MFSRFFINHPRFALVISIVLVLVGVISLTKLPVAEYPEITPPQLYVSATYTGASADTVMETVAIPLEDKINGVDDLLYFSSTCGNDGSYSCTVTFEQGTDSDIAMVNLQNAVKRAEPRLPSEVTKTGITVEKRGSDILAMFTFLTDGSSMNLMELHNYIESNVKDSITRLSGVSSAELMSQKEYAMRIWLDPARMAGLRLSTADITGAIEAQNIQAAAGTVGSEESNPYVNYKLNVKGRLKTAKEFGDIVVRRDADGSVVHLKDIARVEIGARNYTGHALHNGKEAIAMGIYRTPESNALATVRRVKAELDSWNARFPKGVSWAVSYDPTEFIDVSMNEIFTTIVSALLLVILITWLFLQDWRATLVPSIAIPISLLGTFPFMLAMDYSINVLTMFGLVLVIGSLCDDAIVVVENTQALMAREHLSARDAAMKCMTQITGAIIATTLVTVACYVPLAFYGGMVGNIYIQFAMTMCISLCLSTFVAMTLSPVICAYMLKPPREKPAPFFKPFNALMDRSKSGYLFFVRLLARRGLLTMILFAGVVGGAWMLSKHLKSSFLPDEDKGMIMCDIQLPNSASQSRTDAVVDEFYRCIKDVPGIRSSLLVSGSSMINAAGENVAMGFLQLDHWDKRKTKETQVNAIIAEVMKRTAHIAAATIICFRPPAIMGLGVTGGATFELCRIGDGTAVALSETAKRVAMELSADPKVSYAMSAYNADTPQLTLNVNREKAESLGLTAQAIFEALQGSFASIYVNDFTLAGQNYEVKIQATAKDRCTLENVSSLQIANSVGDMAPVSAIGALRYSVGPNQIMRFNKMVCAEMNAQAASGVSSSELIKRVESFKLPDGYHVEWTGISYQEKQNQGQIVFLMALAFTFAYLFLVAQYESWIIPVPVMLTVATAILGSLVGLWLCGTPLGIKLGFFGSSTLSIYAQLGMVMLIGLTAKNAILMVEFSKNERESGKSIFEAAVRGADLRYRAVLMTAWSFVFGVFPLVVATGAGAGSRQAIGVTTFSGMMLATLIGIIFTPALYAVFQRISEWATRKSPARKAAAAASCLLAAALPLLWLSGCAAVGPDFATPATPDAPAEILQGGSATNRASDIAGWWKGFNDPTLNSLIDRAATNSPTLLAAVSRIRAARAALQSTRAALLPSFDADGAYARKRQWGRDAYSGADDYSASGSASWELDLFGGIRRSIEADEAAWLQAVYSYHDAMLSLTASLASNYVTCRATRELLSITEDNLAIQEESAAIAKTKFDAGTGSSYDLETALAQVAATRGSLPSIRKTLAETQLAIENLSGLMPHSLESALAEKTPIMAIPSALPSAVGNSLLRLRPDIRLQEAAVRQACANIGVAEADLYPKFALGGALGIAAPDLSPWSKYSRALSFGPSFSWNIFSFGRRRQIVESRKATWEAAVSDYRATVLQAYQEAETAWSDYHNETARTETLTASVRHYRTAVSLANRLYREGETDYIEVLTSQRSLLTAEEALVNHYALRFTALINLYKSLGGGLALAPPAASEPPSK